MASLLSTIAYCACLSRLQTSAFSFQSLGLQLQPFPFSNTRTFSGCSASPKGQDEGRGSVGSTCSSRAIPPPRRSSARRRMLRRCSGRRLEKLCGRFQRFVEPENSGLSERSADKSERL